MNATPSPKTDPLNATPSNPLQEKYDALVRNHEDMQLRAAYIVFDAEATARERDALQVQSNHRAVKIAQQGKRISDLKGQIEALREAVERRNQVIAGLKRKGGH